MTVAYELARLFRRILDVTPMYRSTLTAQIGHLLGIPPTIQLNNLNNVTKAIAAITGFFDGGFNAPSAANCKKYAN